VQGLAPSDKPTKQNCDHIRKSREHFHTPKKKLIPTTSPVGRASLRLLRVLILLAFAKEKHEPIHESLPVRRDLDLFHVRLEELEFQFLFENWILLFAEDGVRPSLCAALPIAILFRQHFNR